MTRILLTNDDGIHSEGLIKLELALREVGDVYVVAPAAEMSGASHSLTLTRPLRIRQIDERHWTVDLNPGFDPKSSPAAEFQGLFYYWFTMAKALDASGLQTLTTPDGVKHAWRDELLKKLLTTSMTEGFWTNAQSSRWMEEFPVLASSYALIAMDHCLGAKKPGE